MNGKPFKRLVAAACIAALCSASLQPALAQPIPAGPNSVDESGAEMVADAVLVRPIGLIGTIIGGLAFLVTLPLTLPTQSTDEAGRELLRKPFEYTFNRPLGDFDRCSWDRHSCGD